MAKPGLAQDALWLYQYGNIVGFT